MRSPAVIVIPEAVPIPREFPETVSVSGALAGAAIGSGAIGGVELLLSLVLVALGAAFRVSRVPRKKPTGVAVSSAAANPVTPDCNKNLDPSQGGIHTSGTVRDQDSRHDQWLENMGTLAENAWWKDMIDQVDKTDQQLAVVVPHGDATDGDLRVLGQALDNWQADTLGVGYVWGLIDLLDGRLPRTPPQYRIVELEGPRAVMHRRDLNAESFERAALVLVAAGANKQDLLDDLRNRIASSLDRQLYLLMDSKTYSGFYPNGVLSQRPVGMAGK
jgi:hypothetical protein